MRFGPFLAIALILIVVWICAFVLFHVASALIHLLLLFAIIAFVIHLFSGSKRA
ncbi:MAG: lmo0937 family membrane protein [Candidatus Acidiferrales bacterium]